MDNTYVIGEGVESSSEIEDGRRLKVVKAKRERRPLAIFGYDVRYFLVGMIVFSFLGFCAENAGRMVTKHLRLPPPAAALFNGVRHSAACRIRADGHARRTAVFQHTHIQEHDARKESAFAHHLLCRDIPVHHGGRDSRGHAV